MGGRAGMWLGGILLCLLPLVGPVAAEQSSPPTAKEVGVPIYPGATYIATFQEGPAIRYLFGANAVTVGVVRFYEDKTGRRAVLTREPDGIDSYRIVARGDPDASVPELEIKVNHYTGGFAIPDERGETRRFSVVIFVSRRAPAQG